MLREVTKAVLATLRDTLRSRAALVAENTLLRQQVILLHRAAPHPRLKARDRFTIGAITKLFPSLVAAVPIVRPDTVIRWHRSLWKLIWRRRCRRPVGRPPIDADTRALIRRMWTENPLWGEDVIAAELAKLGHHVSPRTVAKYRPARLPRGRGQKWSTFIRNHLGQTWAADWFTIVTVRFEILYAFVILDLGRREILRVGVTSTPSAQYAAQSFVEAVCDRDDQAPRFLIHDRDSIYGTWFRRRVKGFDTRCLATPVRRKNSVPRRKSKGFPVLASRRDQEGSQRQGKGSLTPRFAGRALAHGGQVKIRASCTHHPLVLSRESIGKSVGILMALLCPGTGGDQSFG
jgi:hypothetical protein